MDIKAIKVGLTEVQDFRVAFLREGNFQFIYNKCHQYGWADTWLLLVDGKRAGYGAVWGTDRREDRDSIFELYLLEPFRKPASLIFEEFCSASGASFIQCQSNDFLLTSMLYEFAENINAEAILFEDDRRTYLTIPGVVFLREPATGDNSADAGGCYLQRDGEVVATGGFMLNYNKPYADIYMEVKEPFRRQGFGSLIVQELKKEIYQLGRVPAARCNISNKASKPTLLKAGFKVCGARLKGAVKGRIV